LDMLLVFFVNNLKILTILYTIYILPLSICAMFSNTQKNGSKKKKQVVSFLSYNLFCLPKVAAALSPSCCPLSEERSSAFLKHITLYDVLSLQEVWDPRYSAIEKHARANGMYVVGSSAPSMMRYLTLRVFGGGLVILSKFPIVDTQELLFDRGSASDALVTKGVLYAKIQLGHSFVHVFNTHLQASYGFEFNDNNPYIPIRLKQLRKMRAFIHKLTANDHYPIMVMGDFNVNARRTPEDGSDSHEYTQMLNALRSPQYEIVDILKIHNKGKHPVTYGGKGVLPNQAPKIGGQRLDFILELKKDSSCHNFNYQLMKGSVLPFQAAGTPFTHISDHYAQIVKMKITKPEQLPASLAQASISLFSNN